MNKKIFVFLILLISGYHHITAMKSQSQKIHPEIEKEVWGLIAKQAEHKKRRLFKSVSTTLVKIKATHGNLTRTFSTPVFTDTQKFKLLIQAIKDNKPANVKLYASKEIINRADTEQRTPLIWAAFYGNNGTIIQLLLRVGADPNRTNKHGNTPLHLALLQDEINPGIVQMLIDAGARFTLENTNKQTALDLLKQKRKVCLALKNINFED